MFLTQEVAMHSNSPNPDQIMQSDPEGLEWRPLAKRSIKTIGINVGDQIMRSTPSFPEWSELAAGVDSFTKQGPTKLSADRLSVIQAYGDGEYLAYPISQVIDATSHANKYPVTIRTTNRRVEESADTYPNLQKDIETAEGRKKQNSALYDKLKKKR